MSALPPIAVAVALGDDTQSALSSALTLADPEPRTPWPIGSKILVLRANNRPDAVGATEVVLDHLRRRPDVAVASLAPLPLFGARSILGRRATWVAVDLPDRFRGRTPLRVPREVAAASQRALVTSLAGDGTGRGSRPMLALTRFVHPAQRLAAVLDAGPSGTVAAIGTFFAPQPIALVGSRRGRPLAVVTFDLVAAELAWLALAADGPRSEAATMRPWEDAIVQSATRLDVGARIPSQLALVAPFEADAGRRAVAEGLLDLLRLRLGIR